MSDVFWELLELPNPDYLLNAKGSSVSEIIANTILKINPIIASNKYDLIVVFGDVNATIAGALTAVQNHTKLMHVEAGLRSMDRTMPEEINRIVTDHVSDLLMVSEQSGLDNLKKEGIEDKKIHFVGNIMIECLLKFEHKWRNIQLRSDIHNHIKNHEFYTCTFHRPENVDKKENLEKIVRLLELIPENIKVIFPTHPRTINKLKEFNLFQQLTSHKNLMLSEPLSYFEFLNLISKSKLVLTDSGGIQEETSFLNVPCITFRKNTERPITVELGTNRLVNIHNFLNTGLSFDSVLITKVNHQKIPLWDSDVSNRIIKAIKEELL
jgi:UDP-N-acetylglucosamine 2-epimerase (non-hydrolysing)